MSAHRATHLAVGLFAGVIALIVYAATLHPSIPGGDSGELIAVARVHGVAHPPGYPLYTLLATLWNEIVRVGTIPLRMNLMSAVAAAATVAVIAGLLHRLTHSGPPSFAAAFVLAFSGPFWKYAVVTEVFALNALLAAGILTMVVVLLERVGLLTPPPHPPAPRESFARTAAPERGRPARARGAGTGDVAALALPPPTIRAPLLGLVALSLLGVSHHHTLVLLAIPALVTAAAVVFVPADRWRRVFTSFRAPARARRVDWILLAGTALLALLPLVHLPLAALRDPPLNWGDPQSLEAFLRLLLRADYGTFQLDPKSAGLAADRSHVLLWLQSLPRDMTWFGVALITLGLLALALRSPVLATMLAGFIALQMLFFTRVGFPTEPVLYRGVVERFYILPAVVLAVAVGAGAGMLLRAIPRDPHGRAAARVVVGSWLVAAAIAWPLLKHRGEADQHGNTFVADLGRNVLAAVPQGAVLFVQGDLFHNSIAALQYAEGVRRDVTLVDQEMLTYAWYAPGVRRRAPDALPPRLGPQDRYDGSAASGTLAWAEHLAGRRPLAVLGLKDTTFARAYAMVPRGLVLIAYPRDAAPDLRAQVDSALAVFARMRTASYFERYDPWSFEVESRWRVAELATRTALLLCQPSPPPLSARTLPGFARLAEFIARNRAATEERDGVATDLDLLRAGGMLAAVHPAALDPPQAIADLERYLAARPTGPASDEARQVLAYARTLPPRPEAQATP